MKNADDQFEQLAKIQAGVDALIRLLDGSPTATFRDVVQNVAKTGLFVIPDLLKVALAGANIERPMRIVKKNEPSTTKGLRRS